MEIIDIVESKDVIDEKLSKFKGTILEDIDITWLRLFSLNNCELLNLFIECIKKLTNSDIKILQPQMHDILNVLRFCPLNKVRVVIIGQDPYHDGSAHGIAFSCTSSKIPPSLKQIFACLKESKLMKDTPSTGNLTKWCEQGVLLLNTSLTTIKGKAGEHSKIWVSFTSRLINRIDEYNKKIMWLLWGAHAQGLTSFIKHGEILKYKHPSPMAGSFIDCPHFLKVTEKYKDITWEL